MAYLQGIARAASGGYGGGTMPTTAPAAAVPAAAPAPAANPAMKGVFDKRGRLKHLNRFLQGQGQTLQGGYSTLADIIASRGATDPALLNRQLNTIERGAQTNAEDINAGLASKGYGSSGLSDALQAAALQGGVEQKGEAIAQENALQEQRKREDLGLLQSLILNPTMDLKQLALQRRAEKERSKEAQRALRTERKKVAADTVLRAFGK